MHMCSTWNNWLFLNYLDGFVPSTYTRAHCRPEIVVDLYACCQHNIMKLPVNNKDWVVIESLLYMIKASQRQFFGSKVLPGNLLWAFGRCRLEIGVNVSTKNLLYQVVLGTWTWEAFFSEFSCFQIEPSWCFYSRLRLGVGRTEILPRTDPIEIMSDNVPASTPAVVFVPHSLNSAFKSGDMATSCLRHNQKQCEDIPDEDLHRV